MPEADNLLDFSDLGTLAKENKGSGLDFSDIARPGTLGPEPESVQEFERRGGGVFSNNEFARGVARSTANSAASVLDFVRTFADSDSLKQTSDSLSNLARSIPTKAASLDDLFDDPALIPAYVGRVAGELAPQAVMAYLSGGTGAAIGRSAGLSKAGVRVATGAGAAATSIPQEVGQIARETEELTGKIDPAAALAGGIPAGMLDALSAERIIGRVFNTASDEARRRSWRQVVRDTLKEIPKASGVESITETAQEGLHLLADRAADSTFDLLTEQNGMRLLESAVAGAIGGGLLGGGASLAQIPVQKSERNRRAETLRLTRAIDRELRRLSSEETVPPVVEQPGDGMEYEGGEMPRTPAVWEQQLSPQRLTRTIEPAPIRTPGTGGGEVPRVSGPEIEGQPYETTQPLKPLPSNWIITVQPPEQVGDEVMPGSVQIIDPSAPERGTSENPVVTVATARESGYEVPDFLALPKGRYTAAEAQMLMVMTPSERERYINERKPQAPTVPVQAPSSVAQEEQAQSLPPDSGGVRQARQAPAPEIPPGTIDVVDLSTVKSAANIDNYKAKVQIQHDPSISTSGVKQPRVVDALISVNPPSGKGAGLLMIQLPGKTTRTIWKAKLSDLRQAGIVEPYGQGRFRINLEQLWASPLLVKNDSKDFDSYKLPGQEINRSIDVEADTVVAEAAKISPFLGSILSSMRDSGVLVMPKIRALATARSGGTTYAGKNATRLAEQLGAYIDRAIASRLREAAEDYDSLSNQQKRELLALAQARELLTNPQGEFTQSDVEAITSHLLTLSEVTRVEKERGQVSLDEEGDEDEGSAQVRQPTSEDLSTLSAAQLDTILDRIESGNPELFARFATDPDNTEEWSKISDDIVKFIGEPVNVAESIAEAIWQKRVEQFIGTPMPEGFEAEDHNWLTGVSATGKDGILALLGNRNIQMDPELRRIGLALLSRIPSKYLEQLSFSVTADGSIDGEFIPWLKAARISINATDPQVAAHELSHYLAMFLTDKERSKVSSLRQSDISVARQDPANKEFFDWLDSMGGSARSIDYARFKYGEENVEEIQGMASLGTPFRFATSTEIILGQDKPFGLSKDRNGFVPKQSLLAKMRNQVAKEEMAALAPILATLPDRVNVAMLAERIKKDGPQLEVLKLDAHAGGSQQSQDLARLSHEWYDVLSEQMQLDFQQALNEPTVDSAIAMLSGFGFEHGWDQINLDKAREMWMAMDDPRDDGSRGWTEIEPAPDSATFNYQFVNPKPLKDMPGAVDILVRIPSKVKDEQDLDLIEAVDDDGLNREKNIKFRSHHFGGSDVNVVGWVRAYIDTLPSGEKVFHVFEVQSDWAQQMRDRNEELDRLGGRGPIPLAQDDPLLAFYESAALKAAIRHARELGITKVAISDGETAMITEGHDKIVKRTVRYQFPDGKTVESQDEPHMNQGKYYISLGAKVVSNTLEVPQEPGMRLHYDTTLPNIMRKLTGAKPEMVELGQHQNAISKERGELDPVTGLGTGRLLEPSPRQDLIFKNPDGTPKTSITARMFDVSGMDANVPAQMFRSSMYSVADPLYHLINDDEYFAHYMSEAAGRIRDPELKTMIDRVLEVLHQLFEAVKAWIGNRDAHFSQLIRKFERGHFNVHENGGMLWDRNNGSRPKSLPPIKSLPELRRYRRVDAGDEERTLINTLTVEQNQPLVGHAIEAFQNLDRKVRSELPGIASRAAALTEASQSGTGPETPLRHYAVLVNGLGIQEEAKRLGEEIQQLLAEIQKQNKMGEKSSAAETRAKHLEDTAQRLISDYKSYLLSEQRASRNAGMADGLVEAIKSIDSLRNSTESLKRALEFMAETMSIEELTAPGKTTQEIVNDFKQKIMGLTGATSWQQAIIPPGKDKPGISNEQLRIAVRIMQERQELVQDILTFKDLSDTELHNLISTGSLEFDEQIASLTYRQLRSFLKSYYSVRNKKDKAREIYLKHRARLKDLIDKLSIKVEAEDFIHGQVIGSSQFQQAMSDAASRGFMSAELVRDNDGADVLKRTYVNPLNREERIEIVDGTTKADYEKNIESYEQVATWYEAALDSASLDPLDRERINFELARIYEMEMNPMFNPEMGKRSPGILNIPNVLSNLTGSSLSYAMQRIGGRAAVQASSVFQARSEARRRAAEVRHDMQYPLQRSILEAVRSHNISISRWVKEVAEPVLASYNSIGSKPVKVGETTRFGQVVSSRDMTAIKEMKNFSDAMTKASSSMDLHTARLHPIKVKEVVSGREILRDPQGGTDLIMPRRFSTEFTSLASTWSRTRNGRKAKDALRDLSQLIQSGQMFEQFVLAHIYSTQRYPDYANSTRFGKAYREIYRNIVNGNPPTNLDQVIETIFQEQSGMDVSQQISKQDIIESIVVNEIDPMVNKVIDQQSRDRAADTPGQTVSMQSADNFMTKARGQMIAPDSAYHYSIVDLRDIRWLTTSVLEVHEQLARDGIIKIQKMLQDYINEWSDRAKHPDAQSESRAQQRAGLDWMNYREARQMLNQVNRFLDQTSPDAFRSFLDEQFGGIGRRVWSTIVQSLLQSATVLKNNLLGMNLRLLQFEQQWRGDGLWMGMPKWLLRLPTIAKNGIAWPMRDLPSYVASSYAYRQAKKKVRVNGLVGEDALHAIIHNPELYREASAQVGGYILKRAINVQRARELGAAGPYRFRDQAGRYISMFTHGGEIIDVDQDTASKLKGGINSLIGLFQETGGGVMLPRALAPRKLEQYLNFQAIRHATRLVDELTLNIKEAISTRTEFGVDDPITDSELLGDPKAKDGEATYMRTIFNRSGLNIDALAERIKNNPGRELLEPTEWNSFVLEVAKEMNMPASDNRVTYKSGFARLMSSLMGYGMWYNERLAETLAGHSRKGFDLAAVYRGLFFIGAIAGMGVLVGTPLQRLIKYLLFNEEDQTGKFSEDNTAWRNAAVMWEQTAPFWPIIGSVFSQLYDARAGSKGIFNFLPVSVASQMLQFGNEVAQTGNVFYPVVKLMKTLDPNLKIIVNRLPEMEGSVEINNAARSLRNTASGNVEIRTPKYGAPVRFSPASTQVQMAVNEMAKENPDYTAINRYRDDGVRAFMKAGASRDDAERRFDLSVLARFPQNTVFGRTLTSQEKLEQLGRMSVDQIGRLSRVEDSFDRYASTYGLRRPSEPRSVRIPGGSRRVVSISNRRRRRSGARLVRNRRIGRRPRRLIRY